MALQMRTAGLEPMAHGDTAGLEELHGHLQRVLADRAALRNNLSNGPFLDQSPALGSNLKRGVWVRKKAGGGIRRPHEFMSSVCDVPYCTAHQFLFSVLFFSWWVTWRPLFRTAAAADIGCACQTW